MHPEQIKNIRKVFVGHTPVKTPYVLGNINYMDTGSCWTGKLQMQLLY